MDSKIYRTTIDILRYVLSGEKKEIAPDTDFEDLYLFSKNHGVENMIYVGLRDLNIAVPREIMEKFKQAYEMQIMVEAVQALELEAIGNAFEEAGIDYLPLKGSVIKYLYPMPDYRKSGDIDILIKPKDKKAVHEIMAKNGYAVDAMDEFEHHDGYSKPPFMVVEIHNRLVNHKSRSYGFLSHVWKYTELKSGTKHQYLMCDEMLYTYTVAHLCKHIKNGGAGLKFFADLCVMKKEYNRETLHTMLERANLIEFNSLVEELTEHWFGEKRELSKNAEILKKFIITGGTFGTLAQGKLLRDSAAYEKDSGVIRYKIKLVLTGIFPDFLTMKRKYPILDKYKILLPVMWVVRWGYLMTKGRYRIIRTLSMNENESKQLRSLWQIIK